MIPRSSRRTHQVSMLNSTRSDSPDDQHWGRYVLGSRGRAKLKAFLRKGPLLAFDYDGTLAPIEADPRKAFMRDTTKALLKQLAQRFPCVVLSGRARASIFPLIRSVAIREVIGNHGLEPSPEQARYARVVRRWMPNLSTSLDKLDGVLIENKRYSLAIHYRNAPSRTATMRAIRAALSTLSDARIVGGKCVFNVVPVGALHKGVALEQVCHRLGHSSAIYLGDDITDEDVFRYRSRVSVFSIRVGRSRSSSAQYFLKSQVEMDAFLRLLLAE